MTSLFLNTNTQNCQLDCTSLNVSDTIERECLSVLHKLHDQVNGLQLVQVVVQPLAKLFNPASLAALAASPSQHHSKHSPPLCRITNHTSSTNIPHHNLNGSQNSNASTPSSIHPPAIDCDANTGVTASTQNPSGISQNHSRSQSIASSFSLANHGQIHANVSATSTSAASTASVSTSTYMMSPDTAQALIARLDTDRDVNWLMEIIGYGLSMPFSLTGEQDSVKDCCTIYCEWLASALLPYDEDNEDSKYQQLSKLVPVPIRKDPNRYSRKMLSHLYNVFLPRQPLVSSTSSANSNFKNSSNNQKDESDAILTAVSRQAVLCHRVLRTIESIAHNQSNLMDNETWQHLLALLLTVNDKLLSPPTEPDDIGTQLHDRILGVLFDIVLLACSKSIPEIGLWKTFHEMCINWRHRPALIDHWRRITSLLTKRIVSSSRSKADAHKQQYQELDSHNTERISDSIESSIMTMSYETLSQSWYRFLNLVGNPVELSDPSIISRTDEFYHAACLANSVLDPRQHPCLSVLPQIFLSSMLGLKEFVQLFVTKMNQNYSAAASARTDHQSHQDQTNVLTTAMAQLELDADRPKCNSLLHIFGDWLFSAALIGSDLTREVDGCDSSSEVHIIDNSDRTNMSGSTMSVASSTATATESGIPGLAYSPLFSRRQSHQSTASSHTSISTSRTGRRQSKQLEAVLASSEKITFEQPLSAESFESGQAEAMSTLCKIFASKSPNEDILPNYLARFYLCLQHCLNFGSGYDNKHSEQPVGPIKRHLLASVLTNATALLQRDLDGINLLIPSIIKAIELVFECSEKETPIQAPPRQYGNRSGSIRQTATNSVNSINAELKRASIMALVNLLSYPLHFQELAIRNCLDANSPTTTFSSIRPRLLKLLFMGLQTEKDVVNMQILFAGLSTSIHDLASNSLADGNIRRSKNSESNQNSLDTAKQRSEDNISQNSFVFNSNDGFVIKSLHVTCHLLINIWKHDNLVSLAALEVLSTIARMSIILDSISSSQNMRNQSSLSANNNNSLIEMKNEYMQTTKWICDYICNQCSRPPPAHSRDMHSTIVAAYQCLSVWIYNHPYLLRDQNCVSFLMEVIELGVSGQKSRIQSMNPMGILAQTIISKNEKQLKPSSMRVREAAESLLNICMVRTCQDTTRNMAACDSILTELDIFELHHGLNLDSRSRGDSNYKRSEAYRSFKYFSDGDSMIFALFEGTKQQSRHCPQSKRVLPDSSVRDSVICLIRTPFGKHCWKMKFNYYSDKARDKIISNKTLGLIKRPFSQMNSNAQADNRLFTLPKGHNKSLYFNQSARFFPESINDTGYGDSDRTVESLEDYINNNDNHLDSRLKIDLDKMHKIFTHQVMAEQKVISECSVKLKRVDCEEPQQMTDLETARVIATHLGLSNVLSSLVQGEEVSTKFVNHLSDLDSQSVRVCDSVNIFYVRQNRTSPIEVLESVRARHNVSLEFFEWLFELGQPVVVKDHSRWNGKAPNCQETRNSNHLISVYDQQMRLQVNKPETIDNSFSLNRNQMLTSDHGGAIFDGDRMLLYWTDMSQELAFMVPPRLDKINSDIIICWLDCYDDMSNVPCDTLSSYRSQITNQGDQGSNSATGDSNLVNSYKSGSQTRSSAPAINDYVRYFISPMKNGLFRVNVMIPSGRQWQTLPLVDGMTVSKSMLASLVRESILNLCRRKRLDADCYQPPHVRRRVKIQDICNNYKISNCHESNEFNYNLFRGKASN